MEVLCGNPSLAAFMCSLARFLRQQAKQCRPNGSGSITEPVSHGLPSERLESAVLWSTSSRPDFALKDMASMTSMLSSSGNNYVWRDQSPTQAGIGCHVADGRPLHLPNRRKPSSSTNGVRDNEALGRDRQLTRKALFSGYRRRNNRVAVAVAVTVAVVDALVLLGLLWETSGVSRTRRRRVVAWIDTPSGLGSSSSRRTLTLSLLRNHTHQADATRQQFPPGFRERMNPRKTLRDVIAIDGLYFRVRHLSETRLSNIPSLIIWLELYLLTNSFLSTIPDPSFELPVARPDLRYPKSSWAFRIFDGGVLGSYPSEDRRKEVGTPPSGIDSRAACAGPLKNNKLLTRQSCSCMKIGTGISKWLHPWEKSSRNAIRAKQKEFSSFIAYPGANSVEQGVQRLRTRPSPRFCTHPDHVADGVPTDGRRLRPSRFPATSQSSGSIHATEDDELAALRKKSRDPMSHRI
ncbi:unnamed protein product [Notodromas monacha]|uniref:Uncharacterized protein n=1 Tax=Notodromas monacha TaxID=399045 RepID=A0A7R9BPZ8_9CRUS|nr:unnamed protein product [Notodromas monacha]CAG0918027.1 unnamed protein product [Notodromas monacha]